MEGIAEVVFADGAANGGETFHIEIRELIT